jgi:hypothetical protein
MASGWSLKRHKMVRLTSCFGGWYDGRLVGGWRGRLACMAGPSVSLERLIDRLRELDEETLSEISDFVEFVFQKKEKKGVRLLDAVRQRALPSVTLQQVREDLSTIRGSLSDVVTQLRQERG